MYKGINFVLIACFILILLLFRSCSLNREYISELKKQDSEINDFKKTKLQDSSFIYSQNLVIKIKSAEIQKNEQEIFALRVMKIRNPKEIIQFKTRYVIKTEIPISETEKIDSLNYLRVPVSFSKGERWFKIDGQINAAGTLLIDSLIAPAQFTYSVGDTLRNGLINRLFKKSDMVVRLHIDNPNIQLQGMTNIYIKDRKKWFETTGFKIAFGALLGFGLASAK
jgi:hypothetical protein